MSGRFFQKPGDSDSDSSSESEEELLSEDESDTGVPSTKPAAASLKSKLTKGAADSDSDDSEEEDEEDESEESGEEAGAGRGRAAFLKGAASDDSESEDDRSEKGVVKSAKDKILDELDSSERKLKNDIKISDWNSVNTGKPRCHYCSRTHSPQSSDLPACLLDSRMGQAFQIGTTPLSIQHPSSNSIFGGHRVHRKGYRRVRRQEEGYECPEGQGFHRTR